MDALGFSLKNLCTHSGRGSFGTPRATAAGLLAMAQNWRKWATACPMRGASRACTLTPL